MNETNNTNGGPGTEAKAPHVLDFNGTEIRPGLWAIEADELQRVGNTAYQAGRMERAGEVDQLREALKTASQDQASVAATLRNCREKLAKEREAMRVLVFNLRTITLANHDEATLDAVQRVVAERDDAVGRAALRAIPLRSVDIFGRDGIKIGDIVCMPDGTFAVGP